jgi:hypothetical protein
VPGDLPDGQRLPERNSPRNQIFTNFAQRNDLPHHGQALPRHGNGNFPHGNRHFLYGKAHRVVAEPSAVKETTSAVKEMLSGDSETADSATEMPISSTEKAISVEHPGIVRRLSGASDRETVDSLPEAGVCSTETSGPISDPRANGAQGEKTAVEGWGAEPVVPPRIRPRHPQPSTAVNAFRISEPIGCASGKFCPHRA